MSSRRSVKRNLAVSWLVHASGLLIGVVLMPFVLRTIGDESYGLWIFINAAAGYSGFLYLGLGETVCRYVADAHARKDPMRLNEVVNVVFFVYLGMAAVVLLLAGLAAWLAPGLYHWGRHSLLEIRCVVLILGINVAAGMVTCVFGGVLRGIQRFDVERGLSLVSGLLRFVLTIVFLSSQWSLLTLALIFLAVTLTEQIGHVVFAFRKVPTLSIGPRHLNRSTGRELLSFSSFAFLDLVSEQILAATDTLLIGIILGAKATVPYFIAFRLCHFIGIPIQFIGRVAMPRAGELAAKAQRQKLENLVTTALGAAFLLTSAFFIGAYYFGNTLIETWIGPGYSQSHVLFLLLLSAQIVINPVEVLRSVLFGIGHVRMQSVLVFVEAIANVLLTLILIRPFGLVGVAIGTVVPVVAIELGILVPHALTLIGINPWRLVAKSLVPQLVPLAVLWGYSFLVATTVTLRPDWGPLFAVTLGGGAVLALCWLACLRWTAPGRWRLSAQ